MHVITKPVSKYAALLAMALLIWCAGLALPAQHALAFKYGYQGTPSDTIGVTRPTLTFYFKTDSNDLPVAYAMFLNGQSVPVTYDKEQGAFHYTPEQDLTPGDYTARMSITFKGYQPIEESWTFTVAQDALKELPAAGPDQLDAFAALNDYRVLYGLPQVKLNTRLNASATAHATYLNANEVKQTSDSKESLHTEEKGKPKFIGALPLDRAAYFGYTSKVGEDAAYSSGTTKEAIDLLFDAPYHRNPFLDPNVSEIGIGKVGDYTIIEFGYASTTTTQLVVSPAPGDRYVPTTFEGNEDPDPLRIHTDAAYPVGNPIMAQYYGAGEDQAKLVSAELTDGSKQKVDVLVNTPDNDDKLDNAFIIMPRKPLEANTTYRVKLNLQITKSDGASSNETKEWDFTTEPTPGIGKTKLHQDAAKYKRSSVTVAPFQRVATFGLDDTSYQVDGIGFPMKRQPAIDEGFSYLYIRDLASALGASVDWDNTRRAAIYTKGSQKVTLFTDQSAYEVNGVRKETDTPARLIGENTMVPVRLLAEVLGAKVDYDDATRTVKLTY
ncbi:stalk domain-containing protein [Paenibacillus doosanensis]|uniref:stalk domain-containing protein n=1 Tax=Paenibacillus doosanensis TaxID=1229154 RepID=UPI0021802323|nr:stalk domain-containing protein [Paenibacillus doosanensis]MCS7459143.1 stalk domain-containing protein [Paenibacillus doosanensis]